MEQPRAKVISCIHTDEEFVPNAEDQVFYFFTKFISELTSEELELLLLFITGSLHQPQIIVTFNGQPGLNQGAVSIRKTVLLGMAIPMLKIRRPTGRLIFNMGIPIPGKTVFLIETGPSIPRHIPLTMS